MSKHRTRVLAFLVASVLTVFGTGLMAQGSSAATLRAVPQHSTWD